MMIAGALGDFAVTAIKNLPLNGSASRGGPSSWEKVPWSCNKRSVDDRLVRLGR